MPWPLLFYTFRDSRISYSRLLTSIRQEISEPITPIHPDEDPDFWAYGFFDNSTPSADVPLAASPDRQDHSPNFPRLPERPAVRPSNKDSASNDENAVIMLRDNGFRINDTHEFEPKNILFDAFDWAHQTNRANVVRYLFETCDVNARDEASNRTMLFRACTHKSKEHVHSLLARGADIDVKDRWGNPVLFYASDPNREEIFKIFVDRGADLNATVGAANTVKPSTILQFLVRQQALGHIRVLLAAGAKVETLQGRSKSPLQYAASKGLLEVARLLLDAGAYVDTNIGGFKYTPLMEAAYANHPDLVKLLLSRGAYHGLVSAQGYRTALTMAKDKNHKEVIKVFNIAGIFG